MKGRLWGGLLVIALGIAALRADAAPSVDIQTAKRLSIVLLSQGRARSAHAILTELYKHNAEDPEILITLSRASRALGRSQEAIRLARDAFDLSDTAALRFLSARTMAEALAANGQHTKAQIWLRRAGQYAPTPAAKALIRRDYQYVRSRNPWAFRFSTSVSPTDNVNDAPTTDEIVIGGLVFVDPTARPISGLVFSFSAQATYRLPATETRQTEASLGFDMQRVQLGSDAETINPELENQDFSADRLTLGWSGRFRNPDSGGVYDASARVFADWNGGSRSQNGVAVEGGYSWTPVPRNLIRVGAGIEYLDRLDRPIRSSTSYSLSGKWSRQLQNKDVFSLSVTLSESDSESSAVAHYSTRLRASYYLSKPVAAAQIGFVADFRNTLFDTPLYSADRRQDDGMSLSANATFKDWGIYGFAPVLELKHERVQSNVARFDRGATYLSISFRSTY